MTQIQFKERYYLHLIRSANLAISEISQVLVLIASKRLTLAEKAIMTDLCACTYWDGRLISVLAQLLNAKKYILNSNDGKMLRQINSHLIEQLQRFSKAANHSSNYLEQYFEHDFWLALSQDQISLRLSKLVATLENKCPADTFTKC